MIDTDLLLGTLADALAALLDVPVATADIPSAAGGDPRVGFVSYVWLQPLPGRFETSMASVTDTAVTVVQATCVDIDRRAAGALAAIVADLCDQLTATPVDGQQIIDVRPIGNTPARRDPADRAVWFATVDLQIRHQRSHP